MDKRLLLGGGVEIKRGGSNAKLVSKNILTHNINDTTHRFDYFVTNQFKAAYLVLYWKAGGENRSIAVELINKMKEKSRTREAIQFNSIASEVDKLLLVSYEDLISYIELGVPYEDLSSIIFISTLVYAVYKKVSFKGLVFTEKQLEKIRNGRI